MNANHINQKQGRIDAIRLVLESSEGDIPDWQYRKRMWAGTQDTNEDYAAGFRAGIAAGWAAVKVEAL